MDCARDSGIGLDIVVPTLWPGDAGIDGEFCWGKSPRPGAKALFGEAFEGLDVVCKPQKIFDLSLRLVGLLKWVDPSWTLRKPSLTHSSCSMELSRLTVRLDLDSFQVIDCFTSCFA